MPKSGIYNGGLTREQFLFYEIRIVARLICEGLERDEILIKIKSENLFQFPTEKMNNNITAACFKRIDALGQESLVYQLAYGPQEVAKQINLYAMMRYNRIVWDFMVSVIGEKYRTQDFSFSKKDLNLFFMYLQEQDDSVATWTDATIKKLKQVLQKMIYECGYINSTNAETLNPVYLYPELEEGMRANNDTAAFVAFNYFG